VPKNQELSFALMQKKQKIKAVSLTWGVVDKTNNRSMAVFWP